MKPRPTISNNGDREREFLAIWDAENIKPILDNPATHYWVKASIVELLRGYHDPVDIVHGLGLLVSIFKSREYFIRKLADVHAGEPLVVDGESWAIVGGKKL